MAKVQTMAHRKRPLVVVTRKLPDSIETRMRELFDIIRANPWPFGAGLLATAPTHTLRAVTGPLTLRITPLPPAAALC